MLQARGLQVLFIEACKFFLILIKNLFYLFIYLGLDFDPARGGKYIRFSFAGSTPDMQEVRRRIHTHSYAGGEEEDTYTHS
jgi:hypothetical protein